MNEKWESFAMAPVDGQSGADGEWFLFSLSDNDFVTQDGNAFLPLSLTSGVSTDWIIRVHELWQLSLQGCVGVQHRQPGFGLSGPFAEPG